MYINIMQYLNFFLSCSIKNSTLASLSRLSTIKSGVKVSSQSRKSEFRVFSIAHLNISNF